MKKPIKNTSDNISKKDIGKKITEITQELEQNRNTLAQLNRSVQIISNTIIGQQFSLRMLNDIMLNKEKEKSKETPS